MTDYTSAEQGWARPIARFDDYDALLERTVNAAFHNLGLDAVYISDLTDDIERYRAAAGDAASFGIAVGAIQPRSTTLADRVARGQLPALICDVVTEPTMSDLPVAVPSNIGAYIGVPLRCSDGTLRGIICGVNHEPDKTLDARDVRFMAMLAEFLTEAIDAQRERDQHRTAIENLIDARQLRVAAQPLIDLRTGACLGIKALSRFRPPFGPPAATFAAAEAVGLGLDLERLAVQCAWELLPRLNDNQFLTLNLSPVAATVLAGRATGRPDLPLDKLVVEITEHAVVSSYTDLRNQLQPLREAGLRVAVDDAGAGYASMRHVVELRPDFIKIDRDLVHGLADDHARRVAVSAFVLLALDLGSTVVAEGLEREQDLAALQNLGVDAAQGYLLGKPTTSRRHIDDWLTRAPAPARATPANPRATPRHHAARANAAVQPTAGSDTPVR